MEIDKFETLLKASIGKHPMEPALASLGYGGQLPSEFETAVKTLTSRSMKRSGEKGMLGEIFAMWF